MQVCRVRSLLVGVALLVGSASAGAAPPNDTCASATPIGLGTTAYSTVGATTDAGTIPCGPITNDIWYRYTAASTGILTVSTCAGTAYDSMLAVYGSSCTLQPLIACDDDLCAPASQLTARVIAGQSYLIRVGGFNGASGPGNVTLSFSSAVSASAFTYQGQLNSAGTPYSGTADLRFRLFSTATGGIQLGPDIVLAGVPVSAGQFTCTLDFGAVSLTPGGAWLDIAAIAPSGSSAFVPLTPRTLLTATPFAEVANRLGTALSISGGSVVSTGTIIAPNFQYTSPVSSVISVPASAFRANNGDAVRFDFTGATTVSTTSSAALAAPVSIPSGATITNVTFLYTDNSATDIVLTLSGENDLGAEQIGASGTTTGASASLRTLSVPVSYVANNPQYRYSIRALPTGNWSATLRVAGARITYTLPQPVP